ncbi:MAG: hypothetical protein IJZ86_03985 [Bacteroides sp.]|nr:hypothetical protein [Bacteroides sp.]
MRQRYHQLKAVCLLVLFLGYLFGVTAFTHVHYQNGVLIVHSHPFQQSHTHSDAAFTTIGLPVVMPSVKADAGEVLHLWRTLLYVMSVKKTVSIPQGEVLQGLSLRAPPLFFV